MSPEFLHLSSIIRSPLVDPAGERVGRVDDLIVRLDGKPHPPITGLVARVAGRELFIPIERIDTLRPRFVQLTAKTLDLGRFERRPGELLLARDLQARHLIHVVGAHLIRANEIELAEGDGHWQVVGVDPSGRGVLRRLLPRPLARRIRTKSLVDWGSIEPFVAHVPTARMRIPLRKLSRLRPAQIADLVEAASHDEGEEIIKAVSLDRELEADVFEELDPDHQREFLESRSNAEAAGVLATMAPDDAADLINDLDQDRRLAVLEALPARQQAKVRRLLSYNPESGGGLMNPDYLSLPGATTAGEALEAIRASDIAPEALATVYTSDEAGRVSGTVSVVRLLKVSPRAKLSSIAERDPVTVHADADIHAILRKMSDFNLSTAPVVDENHRMLGVITVDDVLELLLPTGWRRDFGMTAADE
ncbi:MAG: CBS domain-containing protein [Acidimicrobiales bacterium]|jgi:hypothetical protein